ncbi:hypothetical protein GGX14DRAFT_644023 [Mycena pura]|uniref:Protein kinase domain-containing protein n=1 Tax=Mycena pura TaxID=153505 RepID=A0AAD6V8U7_9AGAR|nr:hypothetical protein GGX14DRAFT_644023 [Mycena pura]
MAGGVSILDKKDRNAKVHVSQLVLSIERKREYEAFYTYSSSLRHRLPTSRVRLITNLKPGTLAWKIVHYEADLPVYDENLEIDGDVVSRGIPFIEMPADEDEEEDIDEDCTAELAELSLIAYDSSIHFAKKARFKAEINNLIRCRGSPHIVQLLGKTADNQLKPHLYHWIRQKDAAEPHRRNLLISGDPANGNPEIIIIDLQCFAASYSAAPELRIVKGPDGRLGWDKTLFSFASDVYSLGVCPREFILPGHHRSRMMGYDVPVPFKEIYEACTQRLPHQRPSIPDLRRMAAAIEE